MSHTPTKKSVFDRIGGSLSSNVTNQSTHGFCNAYVKSGTCSLGDACKYIHEQPNVDKQLGTKEEMRITKTITRVVDMSSAPIKSTVTVSNEQRPVVTSNSTQSTRTVVEGVNAISTEHSDRRLSGSDRKQSQRRNSDSKSKSSSKKKSQSSSYENRHSSDKKARPNDSDSPVSPTSDSEHTHSSHKHKQKPDSYSTSSKYRKHDSVSPSHDDEETLNDQLMRQSYNKSPKRTIVITERRKEENVKRSSKNSKSKSTPDIEFLGSQKINRDAKSTETIHQQAENPKKTVEVKREKKSPGKSSSSDAQKRHPSSASSSLSEKNLQGKIEHQINKTRNSSDRSATQSTPPVVQLSPAPDSTEKGSVLPSNETDKSTSVPPPSPICVILDDDSSPTPSIEKKTVRHVSEKKSNEKEQTTSKQNKRPRDAEKNSTKDKSTEYSESKRKRLNDGSSRKVISSSKSGNENRSSSNRSDARRSVNTSSRDESSNRKYKEKSDSKTSRNNDSKDRNTSTSKPRSNNDRRDPGRSSLETKHSTGRHGREKGLENVTDSEEHHDEPVLPKQTALEAYMSMDWSLLSRDRRISSNTQVTSRIVHSKPSVSVCERLLTDEQKEKLNGMEYQPLPLTDFIKQLQSNSTTQIVQSCQRRFGSCAKDIIDMRHKWFIKSIEPVQQYEFINKDHYMAFQQAISSLLNQTSADVPTVQTETTTADGLLT